MPANKSQCAGLAGHWPGANARSIMRYMKLRGRRRLPRTWLAIQSSTKASTSGDLRTIAQRSGAQARATMGEALIAASSARRLEQVPSDILVITLSRPRLGCSRTTRPITQWAGRGSSPRCISRSGRYSGSNHWMTRRQFRLTAARWQSCDRAASGWIERLATTSQCHSIAGNSSRAWSGEKSFLSARDFAINPLQGSSRGQRILPALPVSPWLVARVQTLYIFKIQSALVRRKARR